jgi:protein-histidine pros-kinase
MQWRVHPTGIGLDPASASASDQPAGRESATGAGQAQVTGLAILADLSHALRTHLSGLVGAAELAQDVPLAADAREYVDIIRQSGLAIVELTAWALDAAMLDSGRLELKSETFDARAVLAETVARFAPAAAGKGLALSLTGAEGPPLEVRGDHLRFGQVVGQLVGNAVKFTEAGTVDVSMHVQRRPGGTCALVVSVRDTGPGVRPEDLERIFVPGLRADGSLPRPDGGAGLGLCVSRGLAGLMGGTLGVSSVYGRGAAFHFRVELPLAEQPADELTFRATRPPR